MLHYQDIVDPPLIAGEYKRIIVLVYTDDAKTDVDTSLAGGLITWRLQGALGDLITKDSDDIGGITIDDPTAGSVTIELEEVDSEDLARGWYTHVAELTASGHKRGLFDGEVFVENN